MRGITLLILGAFLAHGLALGELFSLLEGLGLPPHLRASLGWGRAAATAAVLSFSSASLAKHLVKRSTPGTLPVFLWITESLLLVILIAPLLVFQLRQSPLTTVIAAPATQWLVCVAAVLAIEISVAGGMYCNVQRPDETEPEDDEAQVQKALQAARRERRGETRRKTPLETPNRPPGEIYPRVLELLRQGHSGRKVARQVGLSPSTVCRYRKRALQAGELEA